MARIPRIEQRLDNWALWRERQRTGGLGYATQAIFADGPAARGGVGADGPRIPVLELEASETDQAVESLKLGKGHLYQTLHHFYLKGRGIQGTAEYMRRSVSTIHAQLGQADAAIAAWLADPLRRQARSLGVQRLAAQEAQAVLAEVAAQRPAHRYPPGGFVGPVQPPATRSRPKLRLKGFTS